MDNFIIFAETNATTGEVTEIKHYLTSEEIAEQQRIQAEAYKAKRAAEYPSFKDYLDGIVKGDNAQVQAYIDACNAVKNKYPKGAAQ